MRRHHPDRGIADRGCEDGGRPRRRTAALTDREEQVLAAVAGGRTNGEIADELYITLSTVKTHIASLMAKLGVRNRVEIAMWAHQNRFGSSRG